MSQGPLLPIIKEYTLILGASSDLGRALVGSLKDRQAGIIAHYASSQGKIQDLIQENKDLEILPFKADFSDEAQTAAFIKDVAAKNLKITKIVHLPAPKAANLRFKEMKWETLQTELNVQLRSLVLVLQAFLPGMAAAKKGKVVIFLSSYTLNVPPKFLSHYVTAKYALLGLMKALAAEYGDKGVTFNAVSPSLIETAFLENLPQKVVEMTAEQSPLKRNAQPPDVLPLVNFLLSDGADFITGANIPIAGGTAF